MAAKKPHPEDEMIAREIAAAKEFTAYLRLGPLDKTVERGFGSYREARARADAMEGDSRFGRRAMVYAISARGYSLHVTPELAALAGVA